MAKFSTTEGSSGYSVFLDTVKRETLVAQTLGNRSRVSELPNKNGVADELLRALAEYNGRRIEVLTLLQNVKLPTIPAVQAIESLRQQRIVDIVRNAGVDFVVLTPVGERVVTVIEAKATQKSRGPEAAL